MRFNRNVPKENRDYLRAELKKYEAEFDDMTTAEKDALYKWVASGRSPYDNGDYVCYEGGYPVDFISALRMWEEMSKEEPPVPVYDTGREEPVFLATDLVHMEIAPNEELPFK